MLKKRVIHKYQQQLSYKDWKNKTQTKTKAKTHLQGMPIEKYPTKQHEIPTTTLYL